MKQRVLANMRGAALAFALMFGFATVAVAPAVNAADYTLDKGLNSSKGEGQPENINGNGGVFTTIVNVLLFIIGAIAVIMLVIGGIRYTISNGDSNQVTAAKNTILYAIIGLVVAILAYAIVNFVVGSISTN